MAAAFGVALHEAIQKGTVKCDFRGVALGDSWISPIDSVKTWGPYLYATSLLNEKGLSEVQQVANMTEQALNAGQYAQATELWGQAEDIIEELTDDVDFYNILLHNVPDDEATKSTGGRGTGGQLERAIQRHVMRLQQESLAELMNGPIRKHLGDIPDSVTWGGQAEEVFAKQRVDFMKDVVSAVDKLLMENIQVVVYTGQLDLIVDTMGTLAWIEKLQWSGLPDFMKASRSPLYPPSGVATKNTGAFLQTYENFSIFWILKAGHMVPADAGEMALDMVKMVLGVQ
jgi:serine carboxypeptidase 1